MLRFRISFYVYSMDSKSFWIAVDVFVYSTHALLIALNRPVQDIALTRSPLALPPRMLSF